MKWAQRACDLSSCKTSRKSFLFQHLIWKQWRISTSEYMISRINLEKPKEMKFSCRWMKTLKPIIGLTGTWSSTSSSSFLRVISRSLLMRPRCSIRSRLWVRWWQRSLRPCRMILSWIVWKSWSRIIFKLSVRASWRTCMSGTLHRLRFRTFGKKGISFWLSLRIIGLSFWRIKRSLTLWWSRARALLLWSNRNRSRFWPGRISCIQLCFRNTFKPL